MDIEAFNRLLKDVDVRARAVIAALDDELRKMPEPSASAAPPTADDVVAELALYRRALGTVEARIRVITEETSRRLGAIRLAALDGSENDLETLRSKASAMTAHIRELEELHARLSGAAS